MLPTENLVHEHSAIIAVLDVISKIAENIKQKKVFYSTDIDEIVDFLTGFWDKYHNKKEEKIFCSEQVLLGIKTRDSFVNGVPGEHIMGRIYIKEMICCVENCKMGNAFSCERLADCLISYSNLLRSHIEEEESVLFPIINQTLTIEEQKRLMSEFVKIKDEPSGRHIHEKYFEMAKRLKHKYIGAVSYN